MNLSLKSLKDSLMQTSAAEAISEKAIIASHYNVIQKAIDPGYGETTPGYVYEELIHLSYQGNVAEGLASYLMSPLGGTKTANIDKQLKTLKTVHTVCMKGSRVFRHALRKPNNDEVLRASAKRGNYSASQFSSPAGTTKEEEIRKLAMEIREHLYSDTVMEKDDSTETEVPPKTQHCFSGMGGGESTGKYDGFGNTPIQRENYGDKMADLIERAITIPDERKEVMEMCLASPSTGDFQPINLPGIQAKDSYGAPNISMHISTTGAFQQSPLHSSTIGQKHRPGKAGGGWEDDFDDIISKECEATESNNPDNAARNKMDEKDREQEIVKNFCIGHNRLPTNQELDELDKSVDNLNVLKILHCLKQQLKQSYDSGKENSNKEIMRSLVAVEVLLRTNLLNASAYEDALSDELNIMMSIEKKVSSEIAIKSKKISLIIHGLKKHAEE